MSTNARGIWSSTRRPVPGGEEFMAAMLAGLKAVLFRRRVLGDRPRPRKVSRAGCQAPAPPSIERRTLTHRGLAEVRAAAVRGETP